MASTKLSKISTIPKKDEENEKDKNNATTQPLDLSIFDDILGNKFSHRSRLFDFRLDNDTYNLLSKGTSIKPLFAEVSMDLFGGLLAGNFPYYSPMVHAANVNDIKL